MDELFDDDLDNNNNLIPVLNNNDHNEVNLNGANENLEQMNENMENNVHVPNEDMRNNVDIGAPLLNSVQLVSENNDNNSEIHGANENKTEDSLNLTNENGNQTDSGLQVAFNQNSLSTRRSKRKKRHYNMNKNKKWNKVFKRQKSSNVIKADMTEVIQNTRNKHVYPKVPKIIFNNKQLMHRCTGVSKFFLPDKRPRKDIIVPPTKFLLGGNISDPLNLNSLQDEALVSMSAITPKSSPITTPPKVEVIIPPNICDPLHLLDPVDSIEYEKQLVSPIKNRRINRQRSRKKKLRKSGADAKVNDNPKALPNDQVHVKTLPTNLNVSQEFLQIFEQQEYENLTDPINVDEKVKLNREISLDAAVGNTTGRKRKSSESGGSLSSSCYWIGSGNGSKKVRRFDSKDKIVSPVIPQPGAWKRPPKVLLGAPRNRIRTASASGNVLFN